MDWVDDQHVVAFRFVLVLLQADVVEVRNIRHLHVLHEAFGEVLAFVPPPRLVQLAVVLNDELARPDALSVEAASSFALGMDAKGLLIGRSDYGLAEPFCVEPMGIFEHFGRVFLQLLVSPGELFVVGLIIPARAVSNDELARLLHVVALRSQEVHGSEQTFVNELVLHHRVVHQRHFLQLSLRQQIEDVLASKSIDAPDDALLNIAYVCRIAFCPTGLSLLKLDLGVSAPCCFFWVGVIALYPPGSIWAVGNPCSLRQ
jgi:hypothetical protein